MPSPIFTEPATLASATPVSDCPRPESPRALPASVIALRQAFAGAVRPKKVTQRSVDFGTGHLDRLVCLRPGDRVDPSDLWDYAHDLLYTPIQPDLLRYLLPYCLEAWRENLRGLDRTCGAFVEHFSLVLANGRIFDEHLAATQAEAVARFLRESILEEMEARRDPHRLLGAMMTYGVLRPDIERLWTAWWSVESIGRAVTALQYASCLIYSDDENPFFAPWTPEAGGGPPVLWDFEGHLYAHRWLDPNLEFLRHALTPATLSHLITGALERLADEPEQLIARQMTADLPDRLVRVQSRCLELPERLGTIPNLETTSFEWRR